MLYKNDVIFALSTVMGKSAVAVIRISGKDSFKVFSILGYYKDIKPRYATYSKIYNNKNIIDEVLLFWYPTPYSFTGENMVEIQTHGSMAVIKQLYETLSDNFRVAEAGEFSRRAFLNGKIDLTQAEGIIDLIESETKSQAQQALNQMSGDLKNLYEKWRNDIINIMMNIEAHIDFSEEEFSYSDFLQNINLSINQLINEIQFHLSSSKNERIRSGYEIIILGEPNAGKSSLFNYLAKSDLAIVSNIAGTTRDILECKIDINGYLVSIFDTAGLHKSSNIIEECGIEKALQKAKNVDLKIIIFPIKDNKLSISKDIINLIDDKSICLANKADSLELLEKKWHIDTDIELLPISINNKNINNLLDHLYDRLTNTEPSLSFVPNLRYRQALQYALSHLEYFQKLKNCNDIAQHAEELRLA
ncbi:MAG: tRNA uridine-5-carboxymethylaminomethyl(34) synthesis GTPase MnmE, partial [Anaplasmataceae bacterium]|nr:tRNA uridine-5-carboxymethylaminomethyl(34) synthesis GTPase MnmE [Anaplasmataceae bacterium]